ncbi:hypothetical protein A6769_33855 [Nostoc punctiforme NIES-2108]|uniref:Uncharacterized protein n=1 Tax=Nostoc punctiforme NIES-2108 TaxID=1356359 RepID=A0A367R1J7_NOSPU|nr:hypothetical protein A6769_33855 [Nostoc punctiforme NIES-2108]
MKNFSEFLPTSPNKRTTRASWSRVIAFAWLHPNVLKDLRKDPKNTIMKLAGEASPPYTGVDEVDHYTKDSAVNIMNETDNDPLEPYRGYLPIPDPVRGLEKLDDSELEGLLEKGITGILKFDENAKLWKDELKAAWTNSAKLKAIRQDPLDNLIHKDELLKGDYGIFPLPDRPLSLQRLDINELETFIGEGKMDHLGGIFLIGS